MLNPQDYGLIPSKHTDRTLSTIMRAPTTRVSLQNDSQTPHILWSECHNVTKGKGKDKATIFTYKGCNNQILSCTKAELVKSYSAPLQEKLLSFNCINQKEEGPCSLAALVHLLQLYKAESTIQRIITCPTHRASFLAAYQKMGFHMEGYSNWLAFFQMAHDYTPLLLNEMTFIPIHFRGWYNHKICTSEPKDANDYNENINKFLKKLLDAGYAFAAPFEGHFIVIAGYNSNSYLVINSFGNDTGFDGLWFIHPIVEPRYTPLNFCDELTGIMVLKHIGNSVNVHEQIKKARENATHQKTSYNVKNKVKRIMDADTNYEDKVLRAQQNLEKKRMKLKMIQKQTELEEQRDASAQTKMRQHAMRVDAALTKKIKGLDKKNLQRQKKAAAQLDRILSAKECLNLPRASYREIQEYCMKSKLHHHIKCGGKGSSHVKMKETVNELCSHSQ